MIGWSHKYAEIMEVLGQEAYCYNYDIDDHEEIVNKVMALSGKHDHERKVIRTRLPRAQGSTMLQFDHVNAFLENSKE